MHVLTAGHCVTMPSGSGIYSVAAGTTMIGSGFDRDHVIRFVSRVIFHPDYNARTLQNDIAVLQLNQALPLNDHTLIAANLPQPHIAVPPNSAAFISGW